MSFKNTLQRLGIEQAMHRFMIPSDIRASDAGMRTSSGLEKFRIRKIPKAPVTPAMVDIRCHCRLFLSFSVWLHFYI